MEDALCQDHRCKFDETLLRKLSQIPEGISGVEETRKQQTEWYPETKSWHLCLCSSSHLFHPVFHRCFLIIFALFHNSLKTLHFSLIQDPCFLAITNHQPAKTIDHHYNLVSGMFSPVESHPCLHKPVGREQPSCTTCDSPLAIEQLWTKSCR